MINTDVLSLTFWKDNGLTCAGNICGVGRLACMVPQSWFGHDLRAACAIHDYRWDNATCMQDYWDSANEFKTNVWKLARDQGDPIEAEIAARCYYFGVTNEISKLIFESEMKAKGIVL